MAYPANWTPGWVSYMTSGNPADIVSSTTVGSAIGTKVDATNGQSSGMVIGSAVIDAQTTIAAAYASAQARPLSEKCGELADIRDWLVVSDSTGTYADTNTEKFLKALAETAGVARLHIPPGLAMTVNPMIIPTGGFNLVHDGLVILAPNSAASSSVKANLMDFRGSGWSITGRGVFDGNRGKQSWSVGQVVGGLTSNSYATSETWLLDPGSAAVPISDFLIDGVTVQNVGNWPVSFGYATNGRLSKVRMLTSGNSPQFFAGAVDCLALDTYSSGITDAGFSLYAGTTRCSIIGATAHQCNQGFGSYCEDVTRQPNIDPLVANSTTIQCHDGSIGFTTGGQVTALTQIRPTAYNNRSIDDGISGASGISCWGAVGAQDAVYIGNRQSGFGSTAASGSTVNAGYFDSTTVGLVLDGNFVTSTGSTSAQGNGLYIHGTQQVYVGTNIVRDPSGTMIYGIGGTLGAGSVVAPNHLIGTMANGSMMELEFADDTVVLGQRMNHGPAQFSTGVAVTSGQIAVPAGIFAAAGTTQATATLINTQIAKFTSGTGGGLLPVVGTGIEIKVINATSAALSLYPQPGQTISTDAANVAYAVPAGSTIVVVQVAANAWDIVALYTA
ncbi:hypothetical protein [Gluconobacter albidus]|uniref:Pectate lyase superfamily protein domain-containing protein n=1 Tax=Gluconobacter albidus TaxID=318683 RepID=A0AAW3QZC0_9PROT|nr:hypothetical protein [Gluconobacter albidus]KXV39452.1 hypothetical protein AD941_04990 [Gluconobacter albidus]GBQ91015.1 hypothetical protein AA3250_2195 [Gluconobacter albidus NBRC 3250]GLQ69336.1 hypothetical protein GCM10007866_17870 [Gluconobacter albidus]